MLRTGYKTPAEQEQFYYQHVSRSWWRRWLVAKEHEYYAIEYQGDCVGMGGLTHLRRVPGEAEISLIIGPMYRGAGVGTAAVDALLAEAWRLGLTAVIGECYATGAIQFWTQQVSCRPERTTSNLTEHGNLVWRWVRA